jgi:uncharacterized membrane protein
MTLESSKMMGGIGAILMVVGGFAGPYTSVIGLVGLALVLVALNGLANLYKDRRIFNNALFAVFATIVGAVVAAVVVVAAAFGILNVLGIQVTWTNWSAIQNFNWNNFTNWTALGPYIAAIVGALVILVVCLVIAGIFLRRSLSTVAEKSGTHLFATAGLLFLIGAALTIILIGLLLLWIAVILLAVAFFEMKTGTSQPQVPSPPS